MRLVIILFSSLFLFCLTFSLQGGLDCGSCHDVHGGQPLLLWEQALQQDIDHTAANQLCWSCRNDSDAPAVLTHSSLQAGNKYGNWTVAAVGDVSMSPELSMPLPALSQPMAGQVTRVVNPERFSNDLNWISFKDVHEWHMHPGWSSNHYPARLQLSGRYCSTVSDYCGLPGCIAMNNVRGNAAKRYMQWLRAGYSFRENIVFPWHLLPTFAHKTNWCT